MTKLGESANTIDDVFAWAEEMARKGMYDANTGRHMRTALKALASVLGQSEDTSPEALTAGLDSIAERWARANKANPSTMKTYKQRANALLNDYTAFMANPGSFKGRGGPAGGKASPAGKKDERVRRVQSGIPQAVGDQDSPRPAFNTFRLPNGRVVHYSLPEGFTIEDLRRVVYHLLPATSDFDPMRPGGGFPSMAGAIDGSVVQ